jgi:hypothetical protein
MLKNDVIFDVRKESSLPNSQHSSTCESGYGQTCFVPITACDDENMPYLAVKWENENSEEAVSSMYQVRRNKVVEFNGAEKSILPILDIDGISKCSEASAVFYYDGNTEPFIENTNPASYMCQDDLISANTEVLAAYEAKHSINAVDATKNSEYSPINKNSDGSRIDSSNKTDVNIKGAVVVGPSEENNNKAQNKKQGHENKDNDEYSEDYYESDEGDGENGVREITLFGAIFAGIIFISSM